MKRRVVLALALSALVAAATARAESPVRSVTLKNGLRVWLVPDSSTGSIDVAVWYGAGARWEKFGQSGLTHLVERLQYRGTASVPDGEFRRRLLDAGAQLNTSSTTDYSSFWENLPPEQLELALSLEADRMAGLALTPAKVEQERRAMMEESRRLERQPLAHGLSRLVALLFAGQPYATGPFGNGADLARFTAKDVEGLVRERFGPGNALLTIVGRFDPEDAQRRVERLFGALPARGTPAAGKLPPAAPLVRSRGFDTVEGAGALLVAGWRGPGAADPDAPVAEVIARLLAGSGDTRLVAALQGDKSPVASVQSGWDARRDGSLLWCAAAMRPEADTVQVERDLLAATARLAAQPPDGAELDRARKRVLTSVLFALQSPRARAAALGESWWLSGGPDLVTKRLEAIRRVTPADVQRVAQTLLRTDRQAIVWLRGTSRAEGRP